MNIGTEKFALIILATSYIIGSIPFGYIIGHINGIDVRRHGSGNIGATNVFRTLGKKWGVLCFFLDFMKGLVPVYLSQLITLKYFPDLSPQSASIIAMIGSFSGHNWTFLLSFKGGKGVATAAGAIFAIAPFSFLTALFVWIIVFILFRYVSLASIIAALSLPPVYLLFSWYFDAGPFSQTVMCSFTIISFISIFKHRSNIKRLLSGTENKFERKKDD